MSQEEFKVYSVNENLRLCIIENAIFIEELISNAIGNILDIEWKKSKSFGFSSSALSFNQKVQIIQDIKGVDKEIIKKFTCLTNIRNKFAHVSSIITFENLFSSSNNGKEIKKLLEKWYSDKFDKDSSELYRFCFYSLVEDIVEFIFTVTGNHMYEKGRKDGYQEGEKLYIKVLTEEIKKIPNSEKIFELVFEKMDKIRSEKK